MKNVQIVGFGNKKHRYSIRAESGAFCLIRNEELLNALCDGDLKDPARGCFIIDASKGGCYARLD